jgi:hypothetical protein
LVGESDRNAQLLGGWPSDPSGSSEQETTSTDPGMLNRKRDLRVDRQAIAPDIDRMSVALDSSVVLDRRESIAGPGVETAVIDL